VYRFQLRRVVIDVYVNGSSLFIIIETQGWVVNGARRHAEPLVVEVDYAVVELCSSRTMQNNALLMDELTAMLGGGRLKLLLKHL
jgi:hypothetical protein